jgi:hypothetical protein
MTHPARPKVCIAKRTYGDTGAATGPFILLVAFTPMSYTYVYHDDQTEAAMGALNIRDIGDDRKAALDAEASAQGVSVAELVRRFLDEGVERARAARTRKEWVEASKDGRAFEARDLERHGPSLARFRRIAGGGSGG